MKISEKKFVEKFEHLLRESHLPFSNYTTSTEFNYIEGRTDFIASSREGHIVAFEMKITKWKKALEQAYRNTSFAHYSYVVLPRLSAEQARKRVHEFKRRKVGLCVVEDDCINIEIPAPRQTPLKPWLTKAAERYING